MSTQSKLTILLHSSGILCFFMVFASCNFFFFLSFSFIGPHLRHVEGSCQARDRIRASVPAYTIATAIPDLSHQTYTIAHGSAGSLIH